TSDGGIIFLAHEVAGDDALFKLAHGKLKRLARTGERLPDGRTVHVITFGSVRPTSQGEIAFLGYLEEDRRRREVEAGDGRWRMKNKQTNCSAELMQPETRTL